MILTEVIERTDFVGFVKRRVNGQIYGRNRQVLTDGIERTDLVRMKRCVNGWIHERNRRILPDGIERTELKGQNWFEYKKGFTDPSIASELNLSVQFRPFNSVHQYPPIAPVDPSVNLSFHSN